MLLAFIPFVVISPEKCSECLHKLFGCYFLFLFSFYLSFGAAVNILAEIEASLTQKTKRVIRKMVELILLQHDLLNATKVINGNSSVYLGRLID